MLINDMHRQERETTLTWIRVCEERREGKHDFKQGQRRRPITLEDVDANIALF
jgi:hypothetical protein